MAIICGKPRIYKLPEHPGGAWWVCSGRKTDGKREAHAIGSGETPRAAYESFVAAQPMQILHDVDLDQIPF